MRKKIDKNDSSIGIFFALFLYIPTYPALKPFLNEKHVRESDYFSIDNILQMKRFKAAACLMMGVVNFGKVTTTSWHTYTYLEL